MQELIMCKDRLSLAYNPFHNCFCSYTGNKMSLIQAIKHMINTYKFIKENKTAKQFGAKHSNCNNKII